MRRWLLLFLLTSLALVFLDVLFLDAEHAVLWWHKLPGFDLAYGFAGSLLIILGSKALGKHFLQRSEHYYEKGGHGNHD